jgi:hypothetical protein
VRRRRQGAQHRRADAQLDRGVAGGARPAQGVAGIVELGFAAAEPVVDADPAAEQQLVRGIGERRDDRRVASLQRRLLAGLLEALERVGARRLEQPVARLARRRRS